MVEWRFFHEYGYNLNTAAFPVLTANRRTKKTAEREILLFGDSHSWGQGCADYDAVAWYSSHMAIPYSKGYYAGLIRHVRQRLNWLHPFDSPGDLLARATPGREGMFELLDCPVSAVRSSGFYAPLTSDDPAIVHHGYLVQESKFTSAALKIVAPASPADVLKSSESSASCQWQLSEPARKLFIGLVAGKHGGVLQLELTPSPYYVMPDGYPRAYAIEEGQHKEIACNIAKSGNSLAVSIYTWNADQVEQVICIDYGMKQAGTLALSCIHSYGKAGMLDEPNQHLDRDSYVVSDMAEEAPYLLIRGIRYDGNAIRNFSMGGHTVGQWLGDGSSSFNDDSYGHIDELLNYVPFTPALCVIQAPIVNEYLRQTDIQQFLTNMQQLITKLGSHHNVSPERCTDILLFTTPGDQQIFYGDAASQPIQYEDYYEAVRKFCGEHNYGLIDFHAYFQHLVTREGLDHELLYDDPIHPSPFVNTFIERKLIEAFDLLW